MISRRCVVDTSAWIEWLDGSILGRQLGSVFPKPADCLVPTIVQLELAKWARRALGEDGVERVLAYTMDCIVVPLDTPLALLAAELHREHRLTTADAIVYATARRGGARLLTCDAHFETLDDVVYRAKRP